MYLKINEVNANHNRSFNKFLGQLFNIFRNLSPLNNFPHGIIKEEIVQKYT